MKLLQIAVFSLCGYFSTYGMESDKQKANEKELEYTCRDIKDFAKEIVEAQGSKKFTNFTLFKAWKEKSLSKCPNNLKQAKEKRDALQKECVATSYTCDPYFRLLMEEGQTMAAISYYEHMRKFDS